MNKVLIVDDEVLSIEYLKSLSAWKKYGCTEIDSAWIASKRWSVLKRNTISGIYGYPYAWMDTGFALMKLRRSARIQSL